MERIKTPVQIIDKQKCIGNIRNMLQKAALSNTLLRPHFKTHQSVEVGRWFRDEGIDRIAVSSVSMARQFADDGWSDILIAFPVNLREIEDINRLAAGVHLGILVSCPGVVSELQKYLRAPVDLYLKADVGTHRTGFDPENIAEIEKEILQIDSNMIRFSGFIAHAGHTYQAVSKDDILEIYDQGILILQKLKSHFSEKFPGIIISWGDTPSCSVRDSFEGVDEVRPGNFVYYDLMQLFLGVCSEEQIAMVVAAPVVALHPQRNEAVIYAGAVHLSKEKQLLPDGTFSYGMLVLPDQQGQWKILPEQVHLRRISQEHGILKLPDSMKDRLAIGQLAGIIPVHSCLAADLLSGRVIVGIQHA